MIDCSCSFNVYVRLIDGIVSIKNTTLYNNILFSYTVKNTSCWRMLETQSLEWEATDGAACSNEEYSLYNAHLSEADLFSSCNNFLSFM